METIIIKAYHKETGKMYLTEMTLKDWKEKKRDKNFFYIPLQKDFYERTKETTI